MSKFKDNLIYFWKGTDKLLTLLCLITSSFGVLMVYSATKHTVEGGFPRDALTMILAVIIGLTVALLISVVDFNIYCRLWWVWGGLGILLMILVMLIGVAPSARADARTWINLGFIYFQPSELVKIFFITTYSVHLYRVRDEINKIKNVALLALHALIPFMLVSISGDDGSALVFFFIALSMIFVAGLNWKYIVGAFAIVIAAVPLLWSQLTNFQKQRFIVIWDPDRYPGTAYQQNLGLSALYNGGLFGKGLFKGNYTQGGIVPESQNDMIFTVIGEELGLVGVTLALGLLTAIILRIIHNGRMSVDGPAQYACYGIASMIAIQIVINVAMVLRIGPVIGITLPFFSAGGSSTLCLYVGIGLILSIHRSIYTETQESSMHLIGVTSPLNTNISAVRSQNEKKKSHKRRDTKTGRVASKLGRTAKDIDQKADKLFPDQKHGSLQYDFDHKNRKSPRSHARLKNEKDLPSGTYYKARSGSKRNPRYKDDQ